MQPEPIITIGDSCLFQVFVRPANAIFRYNVGEVSCIPVPAIAF